MGNLGSFGRKLKGYFSQEFKEKIVRLLKSKNKKFSHFKGRNQRDLKTEIRVLLEEGKLRGKTHKF